MSSNHGITIRIYCKNTIIIHYIPAFSFSFDFRIGKPNFFFAPFNHILHILTPQFTIRLFIFHIQLYHSHINTTM